MKNEVKVLIDSDHRYPIDRSKIRKKVRSILGEKGLTGAIETSISFVGDRKMKNLNSSYRGIKETTDVLSFPLEEGEDSFPKENVLRLGDIVISYPQARKQAMENDILVDKEINRLIKHGILSLLGLHES